MLKVALIPTSQFGHGASDGCEKVFRPNILVQIGHLRHWSYMSDNDNVSVRQSYIQTKIELAFAAGMSMSFDRSVQHDFILTYAAFGSLRLTLPDKRMTAILIHARPSCSELYGSRTSITILAWKHPDAVFCESVGLKMNIALRCDHNL